MKLVTGTQMKALDRLVIERGGVPSAVLMENAGRQVVRALERQFPDLRHRRVVILAGKGNNGGDGVVAARALCERNIAVHVFLLAAAHECSPETAVQLRLLEHFPVPVDVVRDAAGLRRLRQVLQRADIVIDALLGIGARGAVRGLCAKAIEEANAAEAFRLALDVPSGVDADCGQTAGAAVRADLTVTLGLPKTGLLLHPGREHVGVLEVVPIGYPPSLVEASDSPWTWLEQQWVRDRLPSRPAYSHKGSFGNALLLGGSQGMSGALGLSAGAALRCGVGLLHLGFPRCLDAAISCMMLEAIKHPLPEKQGCLAQAADAELEPLLDAQEAVALGPGLSRQPHTQALIRALIPRIQVPLVIDADGLNALIGHLALLGKRRASTVLTPHPGEFSRLTGLQVGQIEADRLGAALKFAVEHEVVLVLKGVPTVIATPNGSGYVSSTGNSGLAKGGSGDVLTGVLLALLAQGLEATSAACCAAWIHGHAADLLQPKWGERSMLPSDLVNALPQVFAALEAADSAHLTPGV